MQLFVKDVAGILNVSEKTIYRWIKKNAIPFYRINDQVRFNRAEILEWATGQRLKVSPEIFAESGETNLPSLAEALRAGGVVYRVGGHDGPSVLKSMVDVLSLPEEVDRPYLYEVLMARESLGSTGIGDGIAIPHVRNPVVLHVNKPTVTLCFLENPIEFGAIDGKPVDTMFAIISPGARAHIHLLSRLGYVLRDTQLRQNLAERATREVIFRRVEELELTIPRKPFPEPTPLPSGSED
jgi:PTS system nitrogen regulatory IIA component